MRWSLRRGAKGLGADTTAPASRAAAASAAPSEPGWSALPPLAPSWSSRPPLTVEPRPAPALLTDRRPRSRPAREDGAPEPGRVVGLGTVIAPAPAPVPEPVEPPSYFVDQPPLRHATARPITEHAPLTTATPDYVGEPVAPHAAPVPPPRPIARAEPPVEAASEAGARFREALANLHRRGEPDGLPGQRSLVTPDSPPPTAAEPPRPAPPAAPSTPTAPPEPRPAVPGAAPRDPFAAGPPPPPMTHRRNSLAQSRRLGLGAPVQRDTDDEPAATPPPPADIADALEATRAAAEAAIQAAAAEAAEAVAQAEADAAAARAAALAATEPSSTVEPPAPPARPAAPESEGGSAATHPRAPLSPTPTVRPITDGTSRPTSSVAPLRYRAAPRPVEAVVEAAPRPPERAVVTRPPADLARALRSSHGVDVADVEIRRDSAVTAEAAQRRARAFTRGATVHLPEAAGPLTSPSARGLLAHELVHAAQQRRLGSALPGEQTPEGRALEAEALDAERAHGGNPPSITSTEPLRHAPAPVTSAWVEDRITQHALPFEIPQHRPDETLTPQQRDQVRWEANEIAKEVVSGASGAAMSLGSGASGGASAPGGGGGASFSGGGGGGGSTDDPNAPLDIGDMHAKNVEEFKNAILGRYNLQRRQVGLPNLTALPPDQVRMLEDEWKVLEANQIHERLEARRLKDEAADRAEAEKARVAERTKKRQEEREARDKARQGVREEATKQAAAKETIAPGTTWTPGGGMQRGAAALGGAALGAGAALGIGGGDAGQSEVDKANDAVEDADDKVADAQAALDAVTDENTDALSTFKSKTADEFVASLQASYNFQRRQVGLGPKQLTADEEADARKQFADLKAQHDKEVGDKRTKDAQAKLEAAQKARDAAQKRADKVAEKIATRRDAAAAATGAAVATGATAGTPQIGAHRGVAVEEATTTVVPTATAAAALEDHSTEVVHGDSSHQTHDTANLEALAERIYDRLRSRLRTELLIDRERAGLLTDFR